MAQSLRSQTSIFRNAEDTVRTSCKIKGTIPLWLNGQLVRNGPGEFDVGKETFKHWFDGHALIHKYDISDGEVSYMSNFVKSEDYKTNHQNERIILAGFGTTTVPDPCQNVFSRFFSQFTRRNSQNANVNIISLGKTRYAITDAPWSVRVNSDSLDFEEYYDYTKLYGMNMSTAHPHFDLNGDYYNIATHNSHYGIYKVPVGSMSKPDPLREMKMQIKVTNSTPFKPCYFHSFGISENYFILHDHPVRMNVAKLIKNTFTKDPLMSAFEHQKERESVFHVVNKTSGQTLPIKFCSKGRFTFHHANAHEKTINQKKYLIVDLMCADGPTFFYFWIRLLRNAQDPENLKRPSMLPYRFVLPLDFDTNAAKEQNLVDVPGSQASAVMRDDGSVFLTPELTINEEFFKETGITDTEFPTINYKEFNTKPYKYMYCVGIKNDFIFNTLMKVNVETKQVLTWEKEGYYPSEPIFVKNPQGVDEDDGVILSSVVNVNPEDPIFLLVLDAKTFTELGRAEIMAKSTYSFHGFFDGNEFQQI